MSVEGGDKGPQIWSNTQAYVMAVLCLLVGFAVGYLLRGSASSTAPAPVAQQPAMPPAGMGGMGQQQQPTPEQLKAMADQQAAPLLAQLKSKPNDAAVLTQLGNLYFDARVFPAAIDYYQKGLAVNAKDAAVRTDMATAMFYQGDYDHAIAEFNHALQDDPKNGNALFNRGIVKWQGKMDVDKAVATWTKLLETNPNYQGKDKVLELIAQAQKHSGVKPGTPAKPLQ